MSETVAAPSPSPAKRDKEKDKDKEPKPPPPNKKTVIIFSVNDVYEIKHFGRMHQFIKNTLIMRKPALHHVTLAGDFLSPSILSSIDKGKTKIKLMNEVGFTIVSLGNHEFDLSTSTMVDRIAALKARVVNSNIRSIPGTVPEVTNVIEFDDPATGQKRTFTLGWLGFCTENTKRLCNNVPYDITIEPIAESSKREFERMRQNKADFIIAMTHQDLHLDRTICKKEDVDLILGGHDHDEYLEKLPNPTHNRNVWVVKTGKDATTVGVTTIDIELTPEGVFTSDVKVETFDITDINLPTKNRIEQIIKNSGKIVEYVTNKKLVDKCLPNTGLRNHPTPFATFILTKVREYHNVDAVLLPAGILKGKVDYNDGFRIVDLHKEIRWDEFILLHMPGAVLEQVVLQSRSHGPDWNGYMQTDDGIEVVTDPQHISGALAPLSPHVTYREATHEAARLAHIRDAPTMVAADEAAGGELDQPVPKLAEILDTSLPRPIPAIAQPVPATSLAAPHQHQHTHTHNRHHSRPTSPVPHHHSRPTSPMPREIPPFKGSRPSSPAPSPNRGLASSGELMPTSVLANGEASKLIMTRVNNKPIDKKKMYTILVSRSAKDDAASKLHNPPLYEYILKMRAASMTSRKKRRKHQIHKSDDASGAVPPSAAKTKQHYHERPTVAESVIASLITKNWKEMFGPLTFDQVDKKREGSISQQTLIATLKDESLAKAVLMVADTNRSGTIDRHEWNKGAKDEADAEHAQKMAATKVNQEKLQAHSPPAIRMPGKK